MQLCHQGSPLPIHWDNWTLETKRVPALQVCTDMASSVASGAGKDCDLWDWERPQVERWERGSAPGIVIWLGQKRLCVFIKVVGCEGGHAAGLGLMGLAECCALTPVSQVPACAS